MPSKSEETTKKAQQVVDLVRRLQSFHLDHAFEALSKVPAGAVELQVKQWAVAGEEYRTTKIALSDEKALKSVDLSALKKKLSPAAYKAALLLQRDMSFDPLVVAEASNHLPPGMIDIAIGGTGRVAMVGIVINFNCKRSGSRQHWPTLETL